MKRDLSLLIMLACLLPASAAGDGVRGKRFILAESRGLEPFSAKERSERVRELIRKGSKGNDEPLAAARASGHLTLFYTPKPITDAFRAPDRFPWTTPPARELRLSACRGEYESAAVAVWALESIEGMRVWAGDLTGPGATIPAGAVDVRVVKWWYQAGRSLRDLDHKVLVPELLLKDDRLVQVDHDDRVNYLRSTLEDGSHVYLACSGPGSDHLEAVRPVDAEELQPVDIPADSMKHFWVTIRIPDRVPPGRYQGVLTFRVGERERFLPLVVTVLPFALQPSPLIYSIYYPARLSPDGRPTISSNLKSEEQYRAELLDMKAHGVLYPNNWQKWNDERILRMLEIRREVGLPAGRFYTLGLDIRGVLNNEAAIPQVIRNVKRLIDICKPFGYEEIYFYGLDEARGERLRSQRRIWSAIQRAGGKTFVACYHGTFEAMGGLLNCAVMAFRPDPEEARKWHSVGSEVFCYAYPQGGREQPETYRRNFGLVLWRAGYDGAMNFAYQSGFNHIWNDFDSRHYRDHAFTYPTVNGVVGTLQWEGFREAVDDVRYVATLEHAIEGAAVAKKKDAKAARAWLNAIDPDQVDLDALRARIVEWIERLH